MQRWRAFRKTSESAADAVEAGVGRFLEGVLPDADDFPSLTAELAVDTPIARHVVRAFFVPILPVRLWASVAFWTAMPKTAIYKNGNFGSGKGKIGLSE
jgi:hypothetical protein